MAIRVTEKQDTGQLRRIMIVDDSRLMRKSVSKILGRLYDVIEAADGKEAWEILGKDETIEVVCCDLSMPIMDGFGFLGLVHNSDDERIKNTPVIIVTGAEDTEENRNEIFNQGAVDFVSKPFDSVQLKARIKAQLRQVETVQQLENKKQELEDKAATDPITGLGTREFFIKAGQQKISYANRQGHGLIVVQLAIDNFQDLFMQIGRAGAGAILKKVGEVLAKHARQEDISSRISLDGFAALLDTMDMEGAMGMAERVRDVVSSINVSFKEKNYKLTVSIGISQVEVVETTEISELLQISRGLMVQAQKAGGNQVISSEQAAVSKVPPEKAAGTISIEEALELIRKGETEAVAYQIEGLMKRILPLLVLYEKVEKHGLKEALMALRASIK